MLREMLALLIASSILLGERAFASPSQRTDRTSAPGKAPGRSTLVYSIPPGWVDLSPGAPAANFAKLRPAFLAQVRSGNFELFALDKKSGEAFEPRLFAESVAADRPITAIALAAYAEETRKKFIASGASAAVLKKELITIGGAVGGRVLLEKLEKKEKAAAQRVLIYLIPDGDLRVSLSFVSDAATFEQHQPVFEAAASATTGVVPASNATFRRRVLAAIRAAGPVSTVPKGASRFVFSIPPGMTDVTAPGFDPALAEETQSKNFAAYAIGDDGETFNAVVQEGSLPVSEAQVNKLVKGFSSSFAAAGKTVKVTEVSLAQIDAVRSLRVVFDLESEGDLLRGVWHLIPSDAHFAQLTYLCSARLFPQRLPDFDASAKATIGAVLSPPPTPTTLRYRLSLGAGAVATGIGIVGVVIVLMWLATSQRWPPASRSPHELRVRRARGEDERG
jgi:hypothetical protein